MAWYDISTQLITPRRGQLSQAMFNQFRDAVNIMSPLGIPYVIPNSDFEFVDTSLSRPYCWTISTSNGANASMSTGTYGNYSLRFTKTVTAGSMGIALSEDYIPISGYSTGAMLGFIAVHSRINSTASHVDNRLCFRYYDTAFTLVSSRTAASHVVVGGTTTDTLTGYPVPSAITTNIHWMKIKLVTGTTVEAVAGWGEFDRLVFVP